MDVLKSEKKGVCLKSLESYLEKLLTKKRVEKIHRVVEKRDPSFIPIFENIYDEGNMSACMRSAESFGFFRFFVLHKNNKKKANRVSRGSDKWLDISYFEDTHLCINSLKKEGFHIVATHLSATSSIDEVDFTKPTALVFGNEHEGVSEDLLKKVDQKVKIPMYGFVESFNISVAAALSFYHVHLQKKKNLSHISFEDVSSLKEEEKRQLRIRYYLKSSKNPQKLLKDFFNAALGNFFPFLKKHFVLPHRLLGKPLKKDHRLFYRECLFFPV